MGAETSIVRITKAGWETPTMRTVRFPSLGPALPGQFVMFWIPGVDEIPMSLAYLSKDWGITAQSIGEATAAFCALQTGDRVGVRGPFGRPFAHRGRRLLLVGGGTGMAAIAPLVELARRKRANVTVAIGARRADDLLFPQRLRRAGARVLLATDDGSVGHHGFVTEVAQRLLREERYDALYTCGPEVMMAKVVRMARRARVPLQASLERYMKCGVGICDACAIDGMLVCRDGPVFADRELWRLREFGRWHRDACGRREPISARPKPG